jgi:hypothetical protein
MNGERTLFKTMQIALLKSWNKHFASDSEMWRMMRRFICNCKTYNNKPSNMLKFIMNIY